MTNADLNTFPYIKELQINDCFAYQNLHVIVNEDEDIPFKHLILTGKNGSGKTTTLNFLYENLKRIVFEQKNINDEINLLQEYLKPNAEEDDYNTILNAIFDIKAIVPLFSSSSKFFKKAKRKFSVLTYFPTRRRIEFDKVESPSAKRQISNLNYQYNNVELFRRKFKQYLVNKKISQVFAQLKDDTKTVNEIKAFFTTFENTLKGIFENPNVKLDFRDSDYEFYIKLNNKHSITFDQLSDGYSAFLEIILELFIRVEIIREDIKDKNFNPCGFVLIDEPETHLHYKLQEQVLPILTSLFPNLQFIVATHSPAVISSIKYATIFDLDTQKTLPKWGVGSSYSELMITHFGLENEYSNIADEIINTTESIVEAQNISPEEKLEKLNNFFERNENYLSPSLKLSLEVQILKLERQLSTIQA